MKFWSEGSSAFTCMLLTHMHAHVTCEAEHVYQLSDQLRSTLKLEFMFPVHLLITFCYLINFFIGFLPLFATKMDFRIYFPF